MALVQSVPDDEIAAEIAASLPDDEGVHVPGLRAVDADRADRPVDGHRSHPGLLGDRRRPTDPRDLREATERIRPTALAHEQTIPLDAALQPLLPKGLARGATVAISDLDPHRESSAGASGVRARATPGATSLALLLGAAPTRQGSWVAVVGLPSLGLAAADELGVDLAKVAVVAPPPPDAWSTVLGALIGSFDVVLFGAPAMVRLGEVRKLTARARERGSVLVHVDTGAAHAQGSTARAGAVSLRSVQRVIDADLRLRVLATRWHGVGEGHGRLQGRQVTVEVSGRRHATSPRQHDLWLPAPSSVPRHLTAPITGADHDREHDGDDRDVYAGSDVDELVAGMAAARRAKIARAAREPLTPVAGGGRMSHAAASAWSEVG